MNKNIYMNSTDKHKGTGLKYEFISTPGKKSHFTKTAGHSLSPNKNLISSTFEKNQHVTSNLNLKSQPSTTSNKTHANNQYTDKNNRSTDLRAKLSDSKGQK
jgi:hypothetical protein